MRTREEVAPCVTSRASAPVSSANKHIHTHQRIDTRTLSHPRTSSLASLGLPPLAHTRRSRSMCDIPGFGSRIDCMRAVGGRVCDCDDTGRVSQRAVTDTILFLLLSLSFRRKVTTIKRRVVSENAAVVHLFLQKYFVPLVLSFRHTQATGQTGSKAVT